MKFPIHQLIAKPHPGFPSNEEKTLLLDLLSYLDHPQDLIKKVIIGNSMVGVLCGERMGLASHLGATPTKKELEVIDSLPGKSCLEGAKLLLQNHSLSISLGIASANAGLTCPVENETTPIHETIVQMGKNTDVALVGNFPFSDWLASRVGKLHLFELQNVENRVPEDQWENILQSVKVAAITSTVFLTRYASYYLGRTKDATTIFIGPSTLLSPRLFHHGADILAGSKVTDPEKVMWSMQHKGCFSEVVAEGGIQFVVMRKDDPSQKE